MCRYNALLYRYTPALLHGHMGKENNAMRIRWLLSLSLSCTSFFFQLYSGDDPFTIALRRHIALLFIDLFLRFVLPQIQRGTPAHPGTANLSRGIESCRHFVAHRVVEPAIGLCALNDRVGLWAPLTIWCPRCAPFLLILYIICGFYCAEIKNECGSVRGGGFSSAYWGGNAMRKYCVWRKSPRPAKKGMKWKMHHICVG